MLLALARIASATLFQSGNWASVIFSSVFKKASRPSTWPVIIAMPPMPSWPIIVRIMPIIGMPPAAVIAPPGIPAPGAAAAGGSPAGWCCSCSCCCASAGVAARPNINTNEAQVFR